MKINKGNGYLKWFAIALTRALVIAGILFLTEKGWSQGLPGGGSSGPSYHPLATWEFDDTNTWNSDLGYAPASFTNLNFSDLGNGTALMVDNADAAWLQYNTTEASGTNNLAVDNGTVTFWFAPNWSGTNEDGLGPQTWGRLLEVGGYTPDSSFGWWSLYVDPDGANIYFSAQTNDSSASAYTVSAPIDWATNRWHFIALTYSSTNVSLYVDGGLATNDPAGLAVWPGTAVLTNGFYLGSDSNGIAQAHGMFDDLRTYNVVVDSATIYQEFIYGIGPYYMNPKNVGNLNIKSAGSQPSYTPFYNVITGIGNLVPISTNMTSCFDRPSVWITNVIATVTANGKMNVTFTIAGGSNGLPYDVFANSFLAVPASNNIPWAWMGQGYQCTTYMLTNLTGNTCFLILGTPRDTDLDGLTDAYENLVTHSNPNVYSTDGSGMADGWEVLFFKHTSVDPNADPDKDGLSNYQEFQMFAAGYSPILWDSNTNGIGDGFEDYDGDGLANIMEAGFDCDVLSINSNWSLDTNNDGVPDAYETMVGSAAAAPSLPAYSKNPLP